MNGCLNCRASLPPGATACPACGAEVPLWIARGGQTFGPYTLAALQQSQAEGRLGADDQVMIGREGVWQPLAAVLAMTGAKPRAWVPPPPPPPPRSARGIAQRRSQEKRQLTFILLGVGFVLFMFLAMVAAIMIPVFVKARETARQSACLSNLKQLSLGMLMYAQDYGEHLPQTTWSGQRMEWGRHAVEKGMNIERDCPFGDWRRGLFPYVKNQQLYICPSTASVYSYAFNPALSSRRLSDIAEPQRLIMLGDDGLLWGPSPPPHNGGFNAGYVDGHCQWVADNPGPRTAP